MKDLEEKKLAQLGERLRYYRKLGGYSNYEHLAYDVGISRSQYGKYENGGNIKKAVEAVGDYVSDVIWGEILAAACLDKEREIE